MMNRSLICRAITYFFHYPFYLYGLWRIWKLKKPIITFFGGKRTPRTDPYYKKAFDLSARLVNDNFSILTGGGPGIMEAALCGAVKQGKKGYALGIGVHKVDEWFSSSCHYSTIFMRDFAHRKELLIAFSSAFVCFPGGIGTLDEILEVSNLIKTKKLTRIPIILLGTDYWQFFIKWVQQALEKNLINPEYTDLFIVTDDIDQVISIINKQK